jgi:hypothetical protein
MMTDVPNWGCPWHGLIKGDELHLPGDKTLPWPQPPTGDTHLIDFGLPAVTTTPEHQAQGKQWLNKAIIAGGTLHGKALPAGAWIWQDDNGENWLVTHSAHASFYSDGQAALMLTRFGVIGGKRTEITHSLPLPPMSDLFFAVGMPPSTDPYITMHACHPKGASAVFKMGQIDAVAWLKIELSGAAEQLSASFTVYRTPAQTLGTLVDNDHFEAHPHYTKTSWIILDHVDYDDTIGYPSCSGSYGQYDVVVDSGTYGPDGAGSELPPSPYAESVTADSADATVEKGRVGQIISVVYDGPALKDVTADIVATHSIDADLSSFSYTLLSIKTNLAGIESHSPPACVLEHEPLTLTSISATSYSQEEWSAEVTIKIGGAVVLTKKVACDYSGQVELTGDPTGEIGPSTTAYQTWSSHGISRSETYTHHGPEIAFPSISNINQPAFSINTTGAGQISTVAVNGIPDSHGGFSVFELSVVQHSNNAFGIRALQKKGRNPKSPNFPSPYFTPEAPVVFYGTEWGDQVGTPDGPKTVDALADSESAIYASYNPITGAVVRTTGGAVCWT